MYDHPISISLPRFATLSELARQSLCVHVSDGVGPPNSGDVLVTATRMGLELHGYTLRDLPSITALRRGVEEPELRSPKYTYPFIHSWY